MLPGFPLETEDLELSLGIPSVKLAEHLGIPLVRLDLVVGLGFPLAHSQEQFFVGLVHM